MYVKEENMSCSDQIDASQTKGKPFNFLFCFHILYFHTWLRNVTKYIYIYIYTLNNFIHIHMLKVYVFIYWSILRRWILLPAGSLSITRRLSNISHFNIKCHIIWACFTQKILLYIACISEERERDFLQLLDLNASNAWLD